MSKFKNNKNTAARVTGGALVLLSSFVPAPHISSTGSLGLNGAHAATTTIPVTGKFITGITLSAPVALDFGKFVITKKTGTFGVQQAANAATAGADGKTVTAPVRGKFHIKLQVDAAIDVKFSKIGTDLTLGATAGAGAVSQGSMTLSKILLGKELDKSAAVLTLTTGGGTTAEQTGFAQNFTELSGAGGDVTFGAVLKFSGTKPIGSISNSNAGNIVLTVIY